MSAYDGPVGICGMCGNRIALEYLLHHLAVVHDIHEAITTWPDGSPVIVDETLEPKDFE